MVSKMKFEMLKMTGQLVKVLLMPEEFGADPNNPLNIVWMYKEAAAQKGSFDNELMRIIQARGGAWHYSAKPAYQGDSPLVEHLDMEASAIDTGDSLTMLIQNVPNVDTNKKPTYVQGDGVPDQSNPLEGPFWDLLTQHGAASFDKLLRLMDFLRENWSWGFDTQQGLLTLSKQNGEKTVLGSQILGTQSHVSRTWLWAWANEQSQLPPALLAAANWLRQFGESNEIDEFVEAQLPSDYIPGDVLALVCAGLTKSQAYFRGEYEGGAIFLLIPEMPQLPVVHHPVTRIATVFPQVLSAIPLTDQVAAFEAYARYYGFATSVKGPQVSARHSQFGEVTAEFDELRRMINLTASPEPVQV